jgi:hypothetical protein
LILPRDRSAAREPFALAFHCGRGFVRLNLPRQNLTAAGTMPLRCAGEGTT